MSSKIAPRPAWMIAASASGTPGELPAQQLPAFQTAKQRRQARSGGKSRKDRLGALGCVLCRLLGTPQQGKTDLHHIRTGQGGARRAHDTLVIPLCHDGCHQGPHGIHGDRSRLKLAKVEELDLLAETLALLEREQ